MHLVRVMTALFLVHYDIRSQWIISERIDIKPMLDEVKIERYRRMTAFNFRLPPKFHVWH